MTGADERTFEPGQSAHPDSTNYSDVERFLHLLDKAKSHRRSRLAREAPLDAIQRAALDHTGPFVRRRCISFLDHYANEASAHVFALALSDPVEFVRQMALHSISCETCRTEELCVADVVPYLVDILGGDPSVELRHKAIPLLLGMAQRDARARAAVERASGDDPDEIIRAVAVRALAGEHVRARKAYERRARRGAAARPRNDVGAG